MLLQLGDGRLVFCGFVALSGFPVWISFVWGWYNMGFVVLVMLFVLFVVDSCGSGGELGVLWFCWVIVGSAVKLVTFDMLWFCWALIWLFWLPCGFFGLIVVWVWCTLFGCCRLVISRICLCGVLRYTTFDCAFGVVLFK